MGKRMRCDGARGKRLESPMFEPKRVPTTTKRSGKPEVEGGCLVTGGSGTVKEVTKRNRCSLSERGEDPGFVLGGLG